jgi:glutathione S-transferase
VSRIAIVTPAPSVESQAATAPILVRCHPHEALLQPRRLSRCVHPLAVTAHRLHESGLAFEAIAAPTKTHKLPDGTDYYTINPLGYVPLLELDDGTRLTEGPRHRAVHRRPGARQAAGAGLRHAWRATSLMSWLTFIGTEMHKGFLAAVQPGHARAEFKATVKDRLAGRLKWVDEQLAGKDYLLGSNFSVADAYLFVVTNWSVPMNVDLSPYPNLLAFRARMAARPGVQAAMKAEGLLK